MVVDEGQSKRAGIPRPNLFNPSTAICYKLPRRPHITLLVFNALGKHIATSLDEPQGEGYHEVKFNGSNRSIGVYLCRIHSGDVVGCRDLLLIR